MAELILQKDANCTETVSTIHSITEPTLFSLLTTSGGVTAIILFNGVVVATLSDDEGTSFTATLPGDYTVRISGLCKTAFVYTELIEPQEVTVTPAVDGNTTVRLTEDIGADVTSADLNQVSITNVGIAAGMVDSATFPVGATVTYTAYHDTVDNTFKRVPSISYDATGTTFLIAETL